MRSIACSAASTVPPGTPSEWGSAPSGNENERYVVSPAPPRARGRRPRRAVEERVVKQTTELPLSVKLLITNCTELPSRRAGGAYGHSVRVGFRPKRKRKQAIRSIARSAASTRTPPAQGSRRACRETSNRIAPVGKTVDNQSYGTALTSGGRCLRALRQNGIASNRGRAENERIVAVPIRHGSDGLSLNTEIE